MSLITKTFFSFFSTEETEETFPEKRHTEEINGEEWEVYEFTPGYRQAVTVNEISVPVLKESNEEIPFVHSWEELEMDLPKSQNPANFVEIDEEEFDRFVNDQSPPPVQKEKYTLSRFIQIFNQYVDSEIQTTPVKRLQHCTTITV